MTSNASLLPHLASRKPPFTIVSTGTWVILMAPGLSIEGLDPTDDTLANVDVEGRPVATARFMGGREYSMIAGAPIQPGRCLAGACGRIRRHGVAMLCRTGWAVRGAPGGNSRANRAW